MGILVAVTIAFVAFIAVFVGGLRRIGRAYQARIPGAASAEGVVVGAVPWYPRATHMDSPPLPLQLAEVRFKTANGGEHTFTSNLGTSLRPKIGREVRVLYDPEDPSQAQIAPESHPRSATRIRAAMWAFVSMFALAGILALAIAWWIVLSLR